MRYQPAAKRSRTALLYRANAYSLGDQFQEVIFAPAGCQPFVFGTQFEGFPRLSRFRAIRLSREWFSAAKPLRIRWWSSLKETSNCQCRLFSTAEWPSGSRAGNPRVHIVRRVAVGQVKKRFQPLGLTLAPFGHRPPILRPADHCQNRDYQNAR